MATARYDVLIAGGGLAGLTAGLFAARNGRSTGLLLGDGVAGGGHLISVGRIEDFPGFPDGVAGYDLCPMVQDQAHAAGVDFRPGSVTGLAPADGGWTATTSDGEVAAASVIAATGSQPRRLRAPGAERLVGRGVSDCATCDGPLRRGEVVAVVGGGDSALLEALELTNHVKRVLLFHRDAELGGQHTYRRRVLDHPAIEVRGGSVVEDVLGDEVVTGIRTRNPEDGPVEDAVSGVFVYIGLRPCTGFLGELVPLDADGRVPTDGAMRTARPGLFAAGDIRVDSVAQAVAAAGDGATAAMAAHRYLDDREWPPPGVDLHRG